MNATPNPGAVARDRALARARGITTATLVAGLAAAGTFGALAAITKPGTTASVSTVTATGTTSTTTSGLTVTNGLQGAVTAPTQGGRGQVTTGAS